MTGVSMLADSALRGILLALFEALQLPLDEEQLNGLLKHVRMIERWNAVYNLTAVRRADDMLTQHLADCLAVIAPLRHQLVVNFQQPAHAGSGPLTLLDAGSGAGLPGLVLARMCPQLAVTCVDTVGKKAAFLSQVIAETKLTNARSVHGRVEATLPLSQDVVVARAYASLRELVRSTSSALRPGGIWMAMKGRNPSQEIAEVDAAVVDVFHVEQIAVPAMVAQRCLVWMRKR